MTPLRTTISQLGVSSRDQERLERVDRSVVISGAPGSGKTELLAGRVAQALRGGADISRAVLCLGGDASSASMLQGAVAAAASVPASDIAAFSVRGFFERLLRRLAPRVDWPSAFSIYSDDERTALLRILAQTERIDDVNIDRLSRHVGAALHAHPDTSLSEVFATKGARADEIQLVKRYECHVRRARAIDEAGLGQAVARAIVDQPFEERWQFVTIDDAQHLTPALYAGLRPLLSRRVFTMAVCRDTRLRPPETEAWNVATTAGSELACATVRLSSVQRGSPGIQSVVRTCIEQEPHAGPRGADRPILLTALSARDEARWIADQMEARLEGGVDPDQCAVLCTAAPVTNVVVEGLEQAGIPYQVLRSPKVDGPAALLMDHLRAIANPHDTVALFRIMRESSRGIGQATQHNLAREVEAAGCSVWERIQPGSPPLTLPGGRGPYVEAFAEQMAEWRRMTSTTTGPELARHLAEALDLSEGRVKSYTAETLARHEALHGLMDVLAGYPATPLALRERLDTFMAAKQKGSGVVVRRIEEATGRRFDCVVVAGAEEGLLPHNTELRRAPRLKNERRRLTLGLSRAERQLVVSWAKQRTTMHTEPRRQSRFLQPCQVLMADEFAPDDNGDGSYEDVDPHYYRRDLRAEQAGNVPSPSPTDEDVSAIHEGQRVRHSTHGIGVVQSVEAVEDQRIAVIDFEEGGAKKVNLKYARLDALDESTH